MNVYTTTNFRGFWPVGTSAVVVAESPDRAVTILNKKLVKMGLAGDADAKTMKLLETDTEQALVLCDGDY